MSRSKIPWEFWVWYCSCFVKLGFGYVMIAIQFLECFGVDFFAKKDYENLIKISQYGILFIFLFSVNLGFTFIIFSPITLFNMLTRFENIILLLIG